MIQVVYYRKYNRLTVNGHAHAGEPGHDLVCAACSALAYTLAANVGNMEANGHVRNVTVKMEPGDAEICCDVRSGSRMIVACIFEAICVGFEILARDYPQYISYEIRH